MVKHWRSRARPLLGGPPGALAVAALLASCGGDPGRDPEAMDSVLEAARSDRPEAIVDLIEHLDASDPAVRLAAIEALEQLTAETLGYRHYDSMAERKAAIERWVTAYERGDFADADRSSTPGTETDD